MTATRIDLLYRDAANYKTASGVVFRGEPTPDLVARLTAALDGDSIVCEQVGLIHPARTDNLFAGRFPDEEDDHGWVELDPERIRAVTSAPTDDRTFAEFVAACEQAAADGWDPDISIDEAGGWTDPVVAARLRNG